MQQEKQDWQKMSYLTGEPNLQYFLAYIFIYLWVYLFIKLLLKKESRLTPIYNRRREGYTLLLVTKPIAQGLLLNTHKGPSVCPRPCSLKSHESITPFGKQLLLVGHILKSALPSLSIEYY